MSEFHATIDRVASWGQKSVWTWPVFMTLIGLGALLASLVFYPGNDEWTYVFGMRFGGECGFTEATGLACPSCGMTRSWVHMPRGHILQAFSYNVAGATLWLGLVWMGVVGAIRLITRDPKKLAMSHKVLTALVVVWMIGPYLGLWVARMLGFMPLP